MKAVTVNKPDKTLPDQVQQTSFLSDVVCSSTFIITEPLALLEHAWRCRHADGLKYDVHVNPSNVGICERKLFLSDILSGLILR